MLGAPLENFHQNRDTTRLLPSRETS